MVDVTHGSLMATSGAMKLFSRKGGLMKIVAMDILNQAERMRSILV